jgi:transcriptional regulator with PAS, ATPase and Fis domain
MMTAAEKRLVRDTLRASNGNVTHAAKALGVCRRTMQKLKKTAESPK